MTPTEPQSDVAEDTDTVDACPGCEASNIHLNAPGGMEDTAAKGRYKCRSCGLFFDELDTRERRGPARMGLGDSQKALLDADPDAVLPGAPPGRTDRAGGEGRE